MKLQEKMNSFWSLGELPGRSFDDVHGDNPNLPAWSRRRRAGSLRVGSRERREEAIEQLAARIGLTRRI
jgi:hypothetical protein